MNITLSFVLVIISLATDPKYFALLLLEKSAPLFPTHIKSI